MSILGAINSIGQYFSMRQVFGLDDVTSPEMQEAIAEWYRLYYDRQGDKHEDPCQRIPVTVVHKLYKAVFSEYSASPTKENGRASFIDSVLKGLEGVRKKAVQQMLIGGTCLLKPIPGAEWTFTVIPRRNYVPFGTDAYGNVVDVGMMEQTAADGFLYTLLERRHMDETGRLVIESRLFRSRDCKMLGEEIPLNTLPRYERLVPVNVLPDPLGGIGLIPVSCPAENCVDGSPDAVSVYAAAVGLIHNINRNEALLNREFENGRSRIIASADMMEIGADGTRQLDRDLFTAVDDDPQNVGITIFSPALRQESFLDRKKEYLRNVENLIGFKRGLLSDVEDTEKTATEITSSAGEYNLTVQDFQEVWECAVRETVRVCGILGQMYGITDSGSIDPDNDVAVNWGNGILYDEDKEWSTLMSLVSGGYLKPEIAIAWKYDLPWDTPTDLAAIREKYMPEAVDEEEVQ